MNLWQNYLKPKNLAEAMDAFASAPRPLAPIAGGTDLLIDLEEGRHAPVQTLVDITEVEELLALQIVDKSLFVGAGVPVNRIVQHPLVIEHAQALTEACDLIAGPQVRNVATLGGNVAHALPAAEGTIALLALDAQAEIASLTPAPATFPDRRKIPFKDLFLGPGKSSLKRGEELIVGFHLPLRNHSQASCFQRIMRPQGVALPILNCAVWLEGGKDRVKDVRIAVGPGGGTPFRATQTEEELRGQEFSDRTIGMAVEALLAQASFRTSPRRASSDYRQHLVVTLFSDTLRSAFARMG